MHDGEVAPGTPDTKGGAIVQASVGDRIVVRSHHVGQPDKEAEVLSVRGSDGGPPYLVRWSDGHEGVYFPGTDARVVRPS